MDSQLAAARDAARRALPRSTADLAALVRIPSVSGSRAHRGDVVRAVDWLAGWLRRRTSTVHVVASRAGPLVLARVHGRDPERPAVLLYGHLDVRPAGPGWTSPPFDTTIRGRRLVARGASDDKGQLMAQLAALDGWVRVGGPPGDVIVVAEAAEEVGSPTLAEVLRRWRDHPVLRGPVAAVVIADTRAARPGVPSLTVCQRGLLALRLTADVGGPAVHAGRFGGAVLDPTLLLADALLRLRRTAQTWRAGCGVRTDRVPDAEVRAHAGGRAMATGSLAYRSTRRAAVTVSSWRTSGTPGAIPRTARAAVDVRLPPGLDPLRAEVAARDALGGQPGGRCLSVRVVGRSYGQCLHLPTRVQQAVQESCRAGYGRGPAVLASGGSLPAVGVLGAAVHAPVVLLGLGPHDDGAHGPDEYLDLDEWPLAIDTCVCLLAQLSRVEPASGPSASRGGDMSGSSISPGGTGRGAPVTTRSAMVGPWIGLLEGALRG